MCGISGIVNFDQRAVREQDIRLMMHKMKHRGPDDKGIFIDNIVNPRNPTLTPGFNWPSVVGRTIEATINQSKNYYWISKE